jgi:hypothetical protein
LAKFQQLCAAWQEESNALLDEVTALQRARKV